MGMPIWMLACQCLKSHFVTTCPICSSANYSYLDIFASLFIQGKEFALGTQHKSLFLLLSHKMSTIWSKDSIWDKWKDWVILFYAHLWLVPCFDLMLHYSFKVNRGKTILNCSDWSSLSSLTCRTRPNSHNWSLTITVKLKSLWSRCRMIFMGKWIYLSNKYTCTLWLAAEQSRNRPNKGT